MLLADVSYLNDRISFCIGKPSPNSRTFNIKTQNSKWSNVVVWIWLDIIIVKNINFNLAIRWFLFRCSHSIFTFFYLKPAHPNNSTVNHKSKGEYHVWFICRRTEIKLVVSKSLLKNRSNFWNVRVKSCRNSKIEFWFWLIKHDWCFLHYFNIKYRICNSWLSLRIQFEFDFIQFFIPKL